MRVQRRLPALARGSISTSLVSIALISISAGCGGGSESSPKVANATQGPPAGFVNYAQDTGPSISWFGLSAIKAGNTVSGQSVLSAGALWTVTGTKQVDFFVDNAPVYTTSAGAKQPGAPILSYTWVWDTTRTANGPHTIYARVTDNIDRTAVTTTLDVVVAN